jgi:flagellar motor switch protein FliG
MGKEKSAVITAYGHDRAIDRISVSLFDKSRDEYGHSDDSNAETYCETINDLQLGGESWVFARVVTESAQYTLDAFIPLQFEILARLDDRAIQRILRGEIDSRDLVKALKGQKENVREKIFRNMSKRAAQMLQEDMEFMGPVPSAQVKEAQEKIINIIRDLEQTGEIVISFSEGELIE